MFLGTREMKPAFEKSNANRRIRKRPFRALAVAATILVASALAVGCHKKPNYQAEADTVSRIMAQSPVDSESNAEEARINQLRLAVAGDINKLKWEMKGKITHAKRRLLLSGIVDKLQTMRRGAALATYGKYLAENHKDANPFTRKEDSLFIRESIMKKDSMDLVEAMNRYLERSQPSAVPTKWRISPVSAVLDKFKPMLPEARNRHRDSLLLSPIAASYVEWKNAGLIDWLRSDNSILNQYEKMKLRDGLTRKKDSLMVIEHSTVDTTAKKRWEDQLAEEHYKKWGDKHVSGQ